MAWVLGGEIVITHSGEGRLAAPVDGHLVLGGRHPEVDHGHLALGGAGLVPPPARPRPRPGQLELRQREDPVKQTAGLLLGRRGALL